MQIGCVDWIPVTLFLDQESISPTFCGKLFRMIILCAAFLYSHFRLVLFWHKHISVKAALKMLVKLTPGSCLKKGKKRELVQIMHLTCIFYSTDLGLSVSLYL